MTAFKFPASGHNDAFRSEFFYIISAREKPRCFVAGGAVFCKNPTQLVLDRRYRFRLKTACFAVILSGSVFFVMYERKSPQIFQPLRTLEKSIDLF